MESHPKDEQIIDHINHCLADYEMSVESMMLEGLANAVKAGRMTEENRQDVLNEYITKRNASSSASVLHNPDTT